MLTTSNIHPTSSRPYAPLCIAVDGSCSVQSPPLSLPAEREGAHMARRPRVPQPTTPPQRSPAQARCSTLFPRFPGPALQPEATPLGSTVNQPLTIERSPQSAHHRALTTTDHHTAAGRERSCHDDRDRQYAWAILIYNVVFCAFYSDILCCSGLNTLSWGYLQNRSIANFGELDPRQPSQAVGKALEAHILQPHASRGKSSQGGLLPHVSSPLSTLDSIVCRAAARQPWTLRILAGSRARR